jgi:hypothetical protein
MCRGGVWGLRICPDAFEYLPDVGTVRDERNLAHLPTTKRAHQQENLIDAGDQHRPQVVRCPVAAYQVRTPPVAVCAGVARAVTATRSRKFEANTPK